MRYREIVEDSRSDLQSWFRGSKIVGDDGREPLIVHHFTYFEFKQFDRLWGAKHFKRNPEGIDTIGMWFTTNPSARYVSPDPSWGGRRMDCALRITRPLYIDDDGKTDAFSQLAQMVQKAGGSTAAREQLKAAGYDGVVLQSTFLDGVDQTVIIAFEPDQIKVVKNTKLGESVLMERDAPLYHACGMAGAISILLTGEIRNINERTVDPDDYDSGGVISTTRDPRLRYYQQQGVVDTGIAPVQFVLDQRRLRQRFKVQPFDFWDGRERAGGTRDHEAEEQIRADSVPLSYCVGIILEPLPSDFKSRADDEDLYHMPGSRLTGYGEIKKLAKQRGIPVIDKRKPKKVK